MAMAGENSLPIIRQDPFAGVDTERGVANALAIGGDPGDWKFWHDGVLGVTKTILQSAAEIPELGGNIIEGLDVRIDGDNDSTDLMSRGANILFKISDGINWVAEEHGRIVLPKSMESNYDPFAAKNDFDSGWEAAKGGNFIPILKFVRDTSPNAAGYLAMALYAWPALATAEFNRILDDRMESDNKEAWEAEGADVMMAAGGAFLNVWLERFPWMRNLSAATKNKKFGYWRFGLTEEITEFGQGAAEEYLTTVDTVKGLDWNNVAKQGFAEMIGALGVVVGSAPLARARHASAHEQYVSEQTKKEEALNKSIEVENTLKDEIKALELQIRDGKNKSQIPESHEYIKSRRTLVKSKKAAIKQLQKQRKKNIEESIASAMEALDPKVEDVEASTEEGADPDFDERMRSIRESWRRGDPRLQGYDWGEPGDTTRLAEIDARRAEAVEAGRRELPRRGRDTTEESIGRVLEAEAADPSGILTEEEAAAAFAEPVPDEVIAIETGPTAEGQALIDRGLIEVGTAAGPTEIARAIETEKEAITQESMDTGAATKLAEVRDIQNRAQSERRAMQMRLFNERRAQRKDEADREAEVVRQTALADENARTILARIATEDAEANITIDEVAQKYETIRDQVGENYARIYFEEMARLASVYGKVINQEDIVARGPDVVGRRGPAELGFGINAETGQIEEVAGPVAGEINDAVAEDLGLVLFDDAGSYIIKEEADPMVEGDLPRVYVLVKVTGPSGKVIEIPFYISTGAGGKVETTVGKWYPVIGIGKQGWINKGSGAELADYYGIPELREAAENLDATIGDVRDAVEITEPLEFSKGKQQLNAQLVGIGATIVPDAWPYIKITEKEGRKPRISEGTEGDQQVGQVVANNISLLRTFLGGERADVTEQVAELTEATTVAVPEVEAAAPPPRRTLREGLAEEEVAEEGVVEETVLERAAAESPFTEEAVAQAIDDAEAKAFTDMEVLVEREISPANRKKFFKAAEDEVRLRNGDEAADAYKATADYANARLVARETQEEILAPTTRQPEPRPIAAAEERSITDTILDTIVPPAEARVTTTQPAGAEADPVSDGVWGRFLEEGYASSRLKKSIADQIVASGMESLSPRQEAVRMANADEINTLLSQAQAAQPVATVTTAKQKKEQPIVIESGPVGEGASPDSGAEDRAVTPKPTSTRWQTAEDGNSRITTLQGKTAEVFKSQADDAYRAVYDGAVLDKLYKTLKAAQNDLVLNYGTEPQIQYVKNQQKIVRAADKEKRDLKKARAAAREPGPLPFIERTVNEQGVPVQIIEEAEEFTLVIEGTPYETYATRRRAENAATKIALGDLTASLRKQVRALTAGKRKLVRGAAAPLRETARGLRETARVAGRIQATEAREIAGTRTEKARLAPQRFINHWPGKNYKQYIGPVPKSDTATARPNVSRRRVGGRWEVVVNYPGASRLKFNEDFTMFSLQNGEGAQNIVDSIKANAQLFKDSLVAAYQAGDLRRRQSPVDASRNEVVSGEMNDSFFERWVGVLEEADSPQAAEVSQAWVDKEVATTEEVVTKDTFEADQAAEKEAVLLQAEQDKAAEAEARAEDRRKQEADRTRVTTGKKKVESKVVSIEGENYLKLAEQLNIIRQRLDAGEKLNESDQRVVNHALFDQRVVDDELDIEGEPATVFMELNPTMHGMFSSSVEERVDDLFDGLNFLDHDSLEQAQEDLEVIISHANLAWKEPSLAVVPTETTPKLTPPIGFKKGIRIPKGFKKKYAHLDPDVFYNLASEAEKRGIVDPLEFDNFITSNLRIIETEAKQRAKEQVVTDADLAFELTDWAGADEIADFNAQAVKDAQAKKTKKKADKVNPLAILLETPETLLTNLKKTSLYKVGDLQDLAENIKEITPTFIVARKRSALVESIMDWHALQNLQEKATAEEIGAAIEKLQDNITKDNFIEDDINGDIKTIRASGRADIVMPFANPEQVINMFVKELNGIFGVRAVNKMRADSFITFLPNSVAPYAVKAYGVTIPKDTAAFVVGGVDSEGPIAQVSFMHENIAKHFGQESVRGIIMHELGVHYGKRMLEGPEWSNVLSTVKKLWYDGDRDIRAATWVAMLNNYPEYMGMLGGGRLKAGTLKQFNALNKVIEGKHLEDDTRPGTMITGDGVVTRDMHGDVIPPESGGWQMPNLSLNFEAGRIFWEEVLAEYITANPPTRIRVKPSLWRQIQEAARKFFVRMAELFSPTPGFKGPDITTRDLQDMVAYMVQNVPSQQKYEASLRQSGDNKRVAAKRNQARAKFLEGSMITTPVYHANKNWKYHFPIIDRMELGMHFGSVDAALMMIARQSNIYGDISEVPEGKIRSIDEESALYDPWIPDQLKNITNRDLEGIAIRWGKSHLVDKSMDEPRLVFNTNNVRWNPELKEYAFKQENGIEIPLSTLTRQRVDDIYVFEKGAQLKEFYINIKNPLILNSDLTHYGEPIGWMQYANLPDSPLVHLAIAEARSRARQFIWDDTVEKQMTPENFKKFQNFVDKASRKYYDEINNTDNRVDKGQINEFEGDSLKARMVESYSASLRKLFQSMGYDSLQVVNFIEASHTIEYIVFDDSNIKSSDSLEYTPEKMSLNLIRSIDDTVKDEKAIMAPGTESTTRALIQSAIGEGKLRSGLQSIQRAIEPLLTVPGFDLLETQRMLTKGEIWSWENTGRITFDVLNEANPKEKKVIFKYFTEQGASPDGLPDRDIEIATRRTVLGGTRKKGAFHSPTEKINMKAKVIETKEIIENMGEELVGLGLISPDQFAALRGKYLPQLYMSYVFGDQARKTIGYGFKASSLDYTRARKVYGTWMEELIHGKIEDPAFLSSRYQTMVGRDIGIIKLLNYISTDPGGFNWVLPNQLIEINGMKGTPMYFRHEAEGMEYRADIIEEGGDSARATATRALAKKFREASARHLPAENVDSKRYRRVPDTPRYGTMRGMWIVREIYDDMIAPGESFSDQNLAQSLLSDRGLGATITRVFKYTRVPMNPPTQARNLISNTILLHTSGVALHRLPGRIVQAMNDILHDGKYSQLARKYGIESTTFSSQEIGRIDAEFAKIKASEKSWEGMKARGKIFFDEWLDVGGRAYQKSEVLFKVAKMIDMMESKGATEGEAAIAANKAILDYSSVSQGLRWLRKVPFGSPFITFNAKVMFQLARNLQDNPVSFLPYVALPFLLAEALLAEQDDLDDDDIEKLRGMLPEWAEDQGGMYFLPWKDAHGRWRALNIGYMLPWNSHLEIAKNAWKGEFKKSWGASGMMTGPYNAFQGLVNNKDFFTGNEIYNEADSPMQQYQDILMFISSNMIPPFLTPRNRSGNIVTGGGPVIKLLQAYGVMDGNIDRYGLPRVTVPQAYMSMVGLNTYNFNEFAVKEKQRKKMYEVREILDRMRSLMMQTRDPRKREEIRAEYLKLAGKKMIEVREWVAMMQGYEKLFGATQ